MYADYKDRVEFFLVYIREAHPTDGRVAPANELEGINIAQPTDLEGRREVARKCTSALALALPTLIDTMEGVAEKGYSAWPDRIYVIGLDRKIVYRGEPGPAGFKVADAAEAIAKLVGAGGGEAPGDVAPGGAGGK